MLLRGAKMRFPPRFVPAPALLFPFVPSERAGGAVGLSLVPASPPSASREGGFAVIALQLRHFNYGRGERASPLPVDTSLSIS